MIFIQKVWKRLTKGLYKNLLNDVAAGGLDIDKILTQVVMKKNNGDQVKRLFDTLDVDTAAFRKQRFEGSGRVDRSKAPTRSALEFSDTQRNILADAEIDVKDPVFQNKEQVQGILQKEFLRDIVTRVQKGSDIVNYKQIANTIRRVWYNCRYFVRAYWQKRIGKIFKRSRPVCKCWYCR